MQRLGARRCQHRARGGLCEIYVVALNLVRVRYIVVSVSRYTLAQTYMLACTHARTCAHTYTNTHRYTRTSEQRHSLIVGRFYSEHSSGGYLLGHLVVGADARNHARLEQREGRQEVHVERVVVLPHMQ